MGRISQVGKIITSLTDVGSILDVGCRDGVLKKHIPSDMSYFGSDLFKNGNHVNYVGDIMEVSFDRKFDVVTAIDILEHLENPSKAFDKLLEITEKYLIVSLPNCYDLKKRYSFAAHGTMGGKYHFSDKEILDRHRWLMGLAEIEYFFEAKSKKHTLKLNIFDVKYGSSDRMKGKALIGKFFSIILSRNLSTETLIGLFEKSN